MVGLAVAVLLLGTACGDDDEGVVAGSTTTSTASTASTTTGGDTTTTTSGDAVAMIDLTIERVDQNATASLTCPNGGDPTGTEWLADRAAAEAACALITNDDSVRELLIRGPDQDRMCTQIYGGPEQATVTGTIDGQRASSNFTRTDGCGIDDWARLEAILGPAGA